MAEIYDREDLKGAEDKPSSPSPFSTSTGSGKINYTPRVPASKPTSLSTSSSPGAVSYTSSPEIPASEHSLYNSSATAPGRARFGNFIGKRRNKLVVGGAATATIAGVSIIIFLTLLPLKILHIVDNLQSHFFSASQNAMDKESDSLFSNYVRNAVLPSLRSGNHCGAGVYSTINRNCTVIVKGSDLVSRLYQTWSQNHMENDLASMGIEFGYQNGNYYMQAPGLDLGNTKYDIDGFENTTGESLDDFISKDSQITQSFGSTKDFKTAVAAKLDQALQDESKYTQVMYKYKVGRYLERKFGIKRCIIACDARRDFSDWKTKKTAPAVITAQRVLQPNDQILAFVLGCISKGMPLSEQCSVLKQEDPTTEPQVDQDGCESNCISEGEPVSPADSEVESAVDSLAGDYALSSEEDVTKAQQYYSDLTGKGGYLKYLVSSIVEDMVSGAGLDEKASKAAGQVAGKVAAADVPGVGEVLLLAQINNMATAAGLILPAMGYVLNTQTMVHEFAIYRTYADEIKTGNVDAAMVGSFTDSLGSGNQDQANSSDTELGGTASAEQTPLYDHLIEGGSGTGSSQYLCNNGKPVPAGQLVCPEEKADAKSKVDVDSIVSREPSFVQEASTIAGDISNWFNNLISAGLKAIGLSTLANKFVSEFISFTHIGDLFNTLGSYLKTEFLPPTLVGTNTSGGRTFDMIAGGSDVSGNDYAHNGLGGVVLTPVQTATIYNQQQQIQDLQDSNQPILARLFSQDNSSSLINKIALSLPSNFADFKSSVMGMFTNSLGKLLSGFGSIFSPQHALATASQTDPFDITQYGYPADDPIFDQDPEQYWDQHCTTNTETVNWNNAAAQQANTSGKINGLYLADNLQPSAGQVSQTGDSMGTDPCLLIEAAVGSTGGIFNSNLLTSDDLAGSGTSVSNPVSTPPTSGSAQQLAQQILSNKNIQLSGGDVLQDMQDATNNQPGTAGVMTSSAILRLIATVGQSHTVTISAIQSGGTGHCVVNGVSQPKSSCPNDPHYTGDAVDFSVLDGKALTGRDAGSLIIINIAENLLPSGSGFGQLSDPATGALCGPQITLPNGFTQFPDTCNHLHVQVPPGTP